MAMVVTTTLGEILRGKDAAGREIPYVVSKRRDTVATRRINPLRSFPFVGFLASRIAGMSAKGIYVRSM